MESSGVGLGRLRRRGTRGHGAVHLDLDGDEPSRPCVPEAACGLLTRRPPQAQARLRLMPIAIPLRVP